MVDSVAHNSRIKVFVPYIKLTYFDVNGMKNEKETQSYSNILPYKYVVSNTDNMYIFRHERQQFC